MTSTLKVCPSCDSVHHRSSDGEHRSSCPFSARCLKLACLVPAVGERLWRACASFHRQRGAQERGGQVQRLPTDHTESPGTVWRLKSETPWANSRPSGEPVPEKKNTVIVIKARKCFTKSSYLVGSSFLLALNQTEIKHFGNIAFISIN